MTSMSDVDEQLDRIKEMLDYLNDFLVKILTVLDHDHVHITLEMAVHEDRRQPGGEERKTIGILHNK